jgi:hypothetical protein
MNMKAVPVLVGVLCACGGSSRHAASPGQIALEPRVQSTTFYRSKASCAQGPFELELPVGAAKYGEQVELLVRTQHRIELHAVVVADTDELASSEGVFGAEGRASGKPDNARCRADVNERLAAARAGSGGSAGGGSTGGAATGGGAIGTPAVSVTAQLEVIGETVLAPTPVLTLRVPESARASGHITIRFWSIEPNDLDGVAFGISHVVWQPNVSEAEYEAYLVRIEQEEAARAAKVAATPVRVETHVETRVETISPDEQRRRDNAARDDERRREDDDRRRRARAEAQRIAEERAAAERAQFCATHPDDRGCWGPGGLRIHLELEARGKERDAYCAAHTEDARCWTDAQREAILADEQHRAQVALNPPKPTGPPPAPLAETMPPRLSVNATWRPGYWLWTDSTWVWLAGVWRVPEADIVAEQTTTAPTAPPPVKVEAPPAAPVATVVWVPGFWQWDGAAWIWIGGAYQLRPTASLTWRAPAWKPRGSVHVLVPGAWIRIGGGR